MITLSKKRGNGNGSLFPTFRNNFLTNRLFGPGLFDFDDDFINEGVITPPANITETNKDFQLELSAPGLQREDFKIDVENGTLIISAEKEEEIKEEEKNYRRREFSYNKFSRIFQLPENINDNAIEAKYNNGILKVSIPKKESSVSTPKKTIQIK
jgi:HSP20 family protein